MGNCGAYIPALITNMNSDTDVIMQDMEDMEDIRYVKDKKCRNKNKNKGMYTNYDVVITGYVRMLIEDKSSCIILTIKRLIGLFCISNGNSIIYGIGHGKVGEFGMGDNNLRVIKNWTILDDLSQIINNNNNNILFNNSNIIQGKSRYFILTDNRSEIYSCGKNQNYQCGFGPNSLRIISKYKKIDPSFININNNEYIKIVSNGKLSDHQIIITNKNRIFGWGQNRYNQLGANSEKQFVRRESIEYPTDLTNILFINNIDNIKQIECGFSHTLFLTNNGKVFSFGNNEEGQCGLGYHDNNNNKYILCPTLITNIPYILNISVSEHFSNLIDEIGKLWTFGHNHICKYFINHKCIFKPIVHEFEFGNIDNNKLNIISDCGMEHCIVLNNKNGQCWLLGNNRCGQLGVNIIDKDGADDQYLSPQRFQYILNYKYLSIKICQISAGNMHSCLIDENNNLYTFGFNLFKQCNNNDINRICKPRIITKQQIGINNHQNCYIDKVIAGVATTIIKVEYNNKLNK